MADAEEREEREEREDYVEDEDEDENEDEDEDEEEQDEDEEDNQDNVEQDNEEHEDEEDEDDETQDPRHENEDDDENLSDKSSEEIKAIIQKRQSEENYDGLDFTNADLTNITLQDVSIGESTLIGTNMSGITLSNVNLEGSTFREIIMEGRFSFIESDFTSSTFENVAFPASDHVDATGFGGSIIQTSFDFADCRGLSFGTSDYEIMFDESSFIQTQISMFNDPESDAPVKSVFNQTSFNNCVFNQTVFNGVEFNYCYFTSSDISSCVFTNCIFTDVKFSNINIIDCEFEGCTFRKSYFKRVLIYNSKLLKCEIDLSHFEECDFRDTIFIEPEPESETETEPESESVKTVIRRTKFTHTMLDNANLSGLNLSNNRFSHVDLTNTNLSNAEMEGSVFEKTCIMGTNFDGVDVSKLRSLYNSKDLRFMISNTLMPTPHTEEQLQTIILNTRNDVVAQANQIHDFLLNKNINLDTVSKILKKALPDVSTDTYTNPENTIVDYIVARFTEYIRSPAFHPFSEEYINDLRNEFDSELSRKEDGGDNVDDATKETHITAAIEKEKDKYANNLFTMTRWFNSSSYARDTNTRIVLGYITDFVIQQPDVFKSNYIKTWIDDCLNAYNVPEHADAADEDRPISCVKGMIERMVLSLLDNAGTMDCSEETKDICHELSTMAKGKFTHEDLNKITQQYMDIIDPDNHPDMKERLDRIKTYVGEKEFVSMMKEDFIKFAAVYVNMRKQFTDKVLKMITSEADKYESMDVFKNLQFGGNRTTQQQQTQQQTQQMKTRRNEKKKKTTRRMKSKQSKRSKQSFIKRRQNHKRKRTKKYKK